MLNRPANPKKRQLLELQFWGKKLVFRDNHLLAVYFLFGQQTGAKNQPDFPVNWDNAINA